VYRFAIVASEYNSVILDRLIAGAKKALKDQKQVTLIRVPGSFELPLAAKQAALSKKYDGIVALGCVLRGETPHFEHISRAVSDGLQRVALDTGIPVGFGLLTVDTVEQAMARSGESGNKGSEAAMAALEMINVLREI
jgi:6,7-dimethyl-8-ribityllumazine synthase